MKFKAQKWNKFEFSLRTVEYLSREVGSWKNFGEVRKNQWFDSVFQEISGFSESPGVARFDFEKLTPHDGKKFGAPEDKNIVQAQRQKNDALLSWMVVRIFWTFPTESLMVTFV